MRTYTITPVSRVSAKTLGSVYLGTFGVLWLFLEPLGAFGLMPQLDRSSGTTAYLFLLTFPALLLFAFLRWYQWYKTHDLPFILLTIRSAADGVTYTVRIAENMQVGDAMEQFIKMLLRGPAKEKIQAITQRHYAILQVRRGDAYVDVDSNSTLRAAGLRDNDECQIRAQRHELFNQTMFSRGAIERGPNDT
jgi:hypothetical protein